ncbi:MAG: type II toxin-antitoxin system PemK/MazF family toxin [Prolixibacteraceae bacterium]|nr:type II toxin-antitoxin system PemK/MazF family toxin [Prolixibacteraceae bacterium]
MKTGDIILIPFPYAELTNKKVRPAVVIAETADIYKDIVVSAISSVIPDQLTKREIVLEASPENGLRARSIIKTDRIVTLKREDKIAVLGKLSKKELATFKSVFIKLVK